MEIRILKKLRTPEEAAADIHLRPHCSVMLCRRANTADHDTVALCLPQDTKNCSSVDRFFIRASS